MLNIYKKNNFSRGKHTFEANLLSFSRLELFPKKIDRYCTKVIYFSEIYPSETGSIKFVKSSLTHFKIKHD